MKTISLEQLSSVLTQHGLWLSGNTTGSRANLRGANLRYANLSGVPEIRHIDSKILDAISRDGCSIEMGKWHTCETSHCRAGWAIVLAGKEGIDLESKFGSATAGALIYSKSRPGHPVPDFYASNEVALDDIKKHAALDPIK